MAQTEMFVPMGADISVSWHGYAFLAKRHDDGNDEVDPLTFFFVKLFYVA